jgi:hypothetical protein
MVSGTLHASSTFIQYMGVDHRRADIAMTEKLLHRANVVSGLQKVGGEGMP